MNWQRPESRNLGIWGNWICFWTSQHDPQPNSTEPHRDTLGREKRRSFEQTKKRRRNQDTLNTEQREKACLSAESAVAPTCTCSSSKTQPQIGKHGVPNCLCSLNRDAMRGPSYPWGFLIPTPSLGILGMRERGRETLNDRSLFPNFATGDCIDCPLM